MDVKEVYRKLYPLTITMDRYTGVYSGGIFTAWNLDPDEVPWEIAGGDDTAMTIFEKNKFRNTKPHIWNWKNTR